MFLIVADDDPDLQIVTVKVDPHHGDALRRDHDTITVGRYLDKRHWISVGPGAGITTRSSRTWRTAPTGTVTLLNAANWENRWSEHRMPSYQSHRYPVEINNDCVWLYFRFPLSFREVEELMLERGVVVSYETIRLWCAKFGQAYANQLRRRRSRPGDTWHLDEVFIRINGRQHYLWRAVDQHGNVLDVLVQSRRNGNAAKRFFRKPLKGLHYVPRVIATDKLAGYQVAHREMLASVEHRRSKYVKNRAENSHQPTRQR